MTGNTREFMGIVDGMDATAVCSMGGVPELCVNPELSVDMGPYGTIMGLRLVDDVEGARSLVGRRVRVTVEVLDG